MARNFPRRAEGGLHGKRGPGRWFGGMENLTSERLAELLVGGGALVVDDGVVDSSDGLYMHT